MTVYGFRYRRVILSFVAILLVFFGIVVTVILSHEREMFDTAHMEALREVELMGAFVRDAILRHDYAAIEQFLSHWAEEHKEILELKATAANNFIISYYRSGEPSEHPSPFKKTIQYAGRDLVTLEMMRDFSSIRDSLNRFMLRLISGSVLLTVLLGITLWYSMRKLALIPMEREITIRRETEKKFRTLMESAPDGMIYVGGDGRIIFVNAQTEKIFGYSREELQGKEIEMLMPERFRAIHTEERKEYYSNPRARLMGTGLDLYGLSKDGREFPVDIGLSPVETEEGVFVLADIRDITERKAAEKKIERGYYFQSTISSILQISLEPVSLEEQLDQILDTILSIPFLSSQSKGGIYMIGDIIGEDRGVLVMKAQKGLPDAIIKTCSKVPVGKCLCGRAASGKDIIVAGCEDALHDINYEGMALHGNFCVPVLSGEKLLGVMNLIVEESYKDNPEDRELLASVAKTVAGIIERKRAEQEKHKLREQLAQAEKLSALGRLTANVAHEIRNPLTSIGGYARRLNRTALQGLKEKEYVEIIVSEVDRLERILRNVLTYSREPRLNLTGCDMNEVVEEALKVYEVMCKEKAVRAEKSFSVLPKIKLDRDLAAEAITNIISNALDAMPGGGVLTAVTGEETYRGKKYIIVKITDTGEGIPQEKLDMIFEPFFSTKLTGRGTGLGLSICRKIVEDHGGFIKADSKVGEGSTFSLYFPY